MSSPRWNIFNTSGQITYEVEGERTSYTPNINNPPTGGALIRHTTRYLRITGLNWQIGGNLDSREPTHARVGVSVPRSPTLHSNFDLASDQYVQLNIYTPQIGNRLGTGRIREYSGYFTGENWTFYFTFVEQSVLIQELPQPGYIRIITDALGQIVPATVITPPPVPSTTPGTIDLNIPLPPRSIPRAQPGPVRIPQPLRPIEATLPGDIQRELRSNRRASQEQETPRPTSRIDFEPLWDHSESDNSHLG